MSDVTDITEAPRKSTPGHGGYRPGAGRKKKTEQDDAYTLLAKAKAKKESYRAHLAELEYKQKAGELLSVEDVANEWTNQIQRAKVKLFAMPSRLSPKLLKAKSLRDIENQLKDALTKILDELADGSAR